MLLISLLPAATGALRAEDLWSAHIEPLLKEKCIDCHSPIKTKSRFDATSLQSILRGGERGAAVIPGRPDDSRLIQFLAPDADPHMPPKGKLSTEQIDLLRTWVQKMGVSQTLAEAPVVTNAAVATVHKPVWIPSKGMPVPAVIDRFVEIGWKERGAKPAKAADDSTLIRRAYLDLIGRVPTPEETEKFVSDRRKNKRTALMDQLLASPEHPRHLRELFDVVLMGRKGADFEQQRADHHWFDYLETNFRENRPWNKVVRELIVARPENPSEAGAMHYLWERQNNPQAMAESVAPLVFGLQIKCAQCHDHMVAREIKQAHYWGMVAAFNRSKNVDTPRGPAVAESAIGGFVSFANLRKESQPAKLNFFNGRRVDEMWPAEGEKEVDDVAKYLVPPPKEKEKAEAAAVPKFSRRGELARAATEENPLLARATVNRFWGMFMGRGIVHPVDLMDSKHAPSHPDLLDWLARDFEQNGYDVRRLIRNIVTSKAYQLDSTRESAKSFPGAKKKTPVGPDAFAWGIEKPLSAEQLFHSLMQVTGNTPDKEGKVAGRTQDELRRAFVKQFPDLFAPEYNATLQQAMFLANSPFLDGLLVPREGNLTARLMALPTPEARVREAFKAAFGRAPQPDELLESTSYLAKRETASGVKQLLWAMLTSAEFQVNH